MTAEAPRTIVDKIWTDHVVTQDPGAPAVLAVDLHLVHEVTSPQAFTGLRGPRDRRPPARPDRRDRRPLDPDHGPRACRSSTRWRSPRSTSSRRTAPSSGSRCTASAIRPRASSTSSVPQLGLTQPGMTIVCGDSHTSTHGAFGALAFGIGTSEVEMVLATQTLLQRDPKTYEVRVDGRLTPGVSAKDIILALIARIGVGGGTGHVFEYTGEAIRGLTMEQRMTVCNMSIEGGARAGLIAPDDTTFEYLHGRPHAPAGAAWDAAVAGWRTLPTDDGAVYDKTITIDADALEPMVTYGTNPGMGIPITSRVPSPADQADPGQRRALERALEYMDLQPGQADPRPEGRRRVRRQLHQRPDQRPAPGGQRPQGPPRRRRRPADGRAGLGRGEARGRARGPVRHLQGGRRRVARGRLLDVHRHERRPAPARAVRGQHQQPQLRGSPGQGRPDVPGLAPDRGRQRHRRGRGRSAPAARHRDAGRASAVADDGRAVHRLHQPGRPDAGRERRHRPDRPGPLPQGHRQGGPRRGALPRLAVRGGRLAQGPAVRPRPARDGRPEDPPRRRQLRGRLVARARPVGAHRVGRPGDPVDVVRRHLPEQQPQERGAADRRRSGDPCPPVRAARGRPRCAS